MATQLAGTVTVARPGSRTCEEDEDEVVRQGGSVEWSILE